MGVEFVWAMTLADGVNGLVPGKQYCANMLSESVSEASAASTRMFASRWGMEDPEVSMMGVHLKVLGGHPVWPLAFHQLVMARDQRAFVEQHLEGHDFLSVSLGPCSFGVHHLEEHLVWYCDEWASVRMPAEEATVCWRCQACCT